MFSNWSVAGACATASKSNLTAINDVEFVMATNQNECGICKFNTINGKWSQLIKYPDSYILSPNRTKNMLSFDNISSCLYLYTESYQDDWNDGAMRDWMYIPPSKQTKGKIIIIDLKNDCIKTYNVIDQRAGIGSDGYCIYYGTSICINSVYHIIGGTSNSKHLIFDSNSKTLKTMNNSTPMMYDQHIFNNGLIYLASKKCLYFFGGRANDNKVIFSDLIWKYSLKNNKWKLLKNIKLHCQKKWRNLVIV